MMNSKADNTNDVNMDRRQWIQKQREDDSVKEKGRSVSDFW